MPLPVALIVLAALVAVTVVVGLVLRARAGTARRRVPDGAVDPARLGVDGWGARATLVQFSTEFCARCPQTRRTLTAVAGSRPGVRYVDVDLTHRPDIAKDFHVLQTPTVLVLDAAGVIRTRFGGAPARAAVERELTTAIGEPAHV